MAIVGLIRITAGRAVGVTAGRALRVTAGRAVGPVVGQGAVVVGRPPVVGEEGTSPIVLMVGGCY